MKFLSAAAFALSVAAPAMASTVPVTLDFENVASFASIDGLYSAQGISFTGDALGLVNDSLGPYFSNAPSAIGVMAPVGSDATMNVANGFINAVSFFYTSSDAILDGVQVWGGLNGTGPLLASFDLTPNAQAGGCSDSPYCHFDSLSGAFAGTAYSVTFGHAAYSAAFDDVSITAVPEPTTALLVPLALAGLLVARRRA
jgi:hypothetical protein